ncbi:MAG TPA: hypothetical protein VMS01_04190 [Stellaceae bacterium]|nr:hypothetical protein [Stellaceae bacterium]
MGVKSLGAGIGTPAFFARQAAAPTTSVPAYNAAAPSVNPPFFVEPTQQLLAALGVAGPALIVGLSGGPAGAYSPLWGGAEVWASLDGTNYGQPFADDAFFGVSAMGLTTAALAAYGGVNPDTADTLAVDLSQSRGTLASVSPTSAAAFVSLCAVQASGGPIEFLAFETASLVGASAYHLTTLYRGLYGTDAASHALGAQFVYLGSGEYFAQPLPAQYTGVPLEFKFPSFNSTGGGLQSLAAATAYPYTPAGSGSLPGPGFQTDVITTNTNISL